MPSDEDTPTRGPQLASFNEKLPREHLSRLEKETPWDRVGFAFALSRC